MFRGGIIMARITVILDEVIDLSLNSNTGEPNPAKAAVLCEMAGCGGVAIQIRDGNFTPRIERTIKSIKDVLGIPLALIVSADDKTIEKVVDLQPNLVVLNNYISGGNDYISRLQISNIIAALEILPEIDQVKASAKLKADYVVIDTSSFCREKDLSARVDMLNKISKTAALAERLSMGVAVAGPVMQTDLAKLAKIEQIEDFFIGHEVISKAVLYGFEKAIAELKLEITGR